MRVSKLLTLLLAVTLITIGCNSATNSSGETGSLTVTMTDDPFPAEMVAEANVTINKIEIREDSTEDDSAAFTVLSEEEQSYNLLDLQNGIKTTLADLEIEAGSYDLIRLYVSEASVVLTDSTTYDLFVPSGAQTGIKIFIHPSMEITGGSDTELLFDFDVAKSFVARGNMNSPAGIKGFNFKPTLRAVVASTTGGIEGVATDTSGVALDNVHIEAIQDSVIANAFTDSTGAYAIIGLEEGIYDLRASKDGYDTLTVTGLEVTSTETTTADVELTPAN